VVLLLDLESPWDLDLDMALDPDILDFVPDFDTQLQDQGTRGTLYPVETEERQLRGSVTFLVICDI